MKPSAEVNGKVTATVNCSVCAARTDSIFAALSHEQFSICQAHRVANTYPAGQVIFGEGALPSALYCMFSGKVKLSKSGEHGKQPIVRIAQGGDVLGYRSLLLNEPYRGTAETIEPSVICLIPKNDFMNLLNKSLTFNRRLLDRLAQDLGEAEQHVLELVDTPALQRLARALLTLAKRFGKPAGKGVSLEIPLTREEIGEIIGTTPETTIRMLSTLKDQKVVVLGRRKIIVLDHKRLEQVAADS